MNTFCDITFVSSSFTLNKFEVIFLLSINFLATEEEYIFCFQVIFRGRKEPLLMKTVSRVLPPQVGINHSNVKKLASSEMR